MSFMELATSIEQWVDEGVVNGASIAIEHRGELVAHHHAGRANAHYRVDDDTLFGLASLSKPITAAAFICLVDDGALSLDDTVTSVLPDFGANVDLLIANAMLEMQRDNITFRQLLAHTSGLPENVSHPNFASLPSTDAQIDNMLQEPLQEAPGQVLRYSNLGPGIAARAAAEVSGKSFHDFVQTRILDPMNLKNIVLAPGERESARIATLQDPANPGTNYESYNSAWWRSGGIPWGGYFGTTRDVLAFATSFLPHRSSPLSELSKREMTSDQVKGLSGGVDSMHTVWHPGFWGIGWEVKGSKPKHWTGNRTSPGTYDHWGFAGTLCWVDPARELGVAVFANRSVLTPWPFRPPRWTTLSDAICEEADRS